jgi:hypothetical protein
LTNSFRFYKFHDLPAGEIYILSVSGKKYVFNPSTQAVNVMDELQNGDLVAENQKAAKKGRRVSENAPSFFLKASTLPADRRRLG